MRAAGYETFYREKSGKANLPAIRTQFDHRKDVHMVNALRTGYAARGMVDDAIRFLVALRDRDEYELINLGNPDIRPVAGLVALLERALGKKAKLEIVSLPPGMTAVKTPNLERQSRLGLKPEVTLSEGVRRIAEEVSR